MAREVISLNVGQCGIQLGHSVWEQYCAEHGIDTTGKNAKAHDTSFLSFYEETSAGQYAARNLMIDLEPTAIDNVKNGKYSRIFHPEFLLSGQEDAENSFARGHYTVGKGMIDEFNEGLRKLVENCDNVQGFIMNHSVGGGTGSGLGCLILERISVDYRKKAKVGFEVYPSSKYSNCVPDVYNSLLSTHWLLDHTEQSVIYDNEKIYEICQRDLNIAKPTYHNMNRLVSKNISSFTSSSRFEGELNVDLNEYQTGLVPFPRLHFLITGMSPMVSKYDRYDFIYSSIDQSPLIKQLNVPQIINEEIAEYTTSIFDQSLHSITENCVQSKSFFQKIDDFDAEDDKNMAVWMYFRGDIKAKEANLKMQWLKSNKKVTFVEWGPTWFKNEVNEHNYAILEDDDICPSERSVAMFGNNPAMGRFFRKRILSKFDSMYSQRAYVHWYVGEGMEEKEFVEAREDLGFLEKDYLDVLSEGTTDEDESWD